MDPISSFRSPLGSLIVSTILVVASVFVVFLAFLGLTLAEGPDLMLLKIATVFPALMTITAILRLAVIGSRNIRIDRTQLFHQQLFKNCTVPLSRVTLIQLIKTANNNVGSLKLIWPDGALIIDRSSVGDFPALLSAIRRAAGHASVEDVTAFLSEGADGV